MRKFVLFAVCCALASAGTAHAAQKTQVETPAQILRLMACRAITASDERLACFDRETAAFNQAIAASDLVVLDRQKAREASRSLFGFSLGTLGGIFGGADGDVKQIDGTVDKTGRNIDGGWIFYLADGSVWNQTDDWPLGLPPKKGDQVVVTRGLMGSFRLKLNKQPEIKVKRIG